VFQTPDPEVTRKKSYEANKIRADATARYHERRDALAKLIADLNNVLVNALTQGLLPELTPELQGRIKNI
jgi:hypothetical protein